MEVRRGEWEGGYMIEPLMDMIKYVLHVSEWIWHSRISAVVLRRFRGTNEA